MQIEFHPERFTERLIAEYKAIEADLDHNSGDTDDSENENHKTLNREAALRELERMVSWCVKEDKFQDFRPDEYIRIDGIPEYPIYLFRSPPYIAAVAVLSPELRVCLNLYTSSGAKGRSDGPLDPDAR